MDSVTNQKHALERFGKILMKDVRDIVISQLEGIRTGHSRAPADQPLHESWKDMDPALFNSLVSVTVDSCLHYFLWMFEQHEDYIDLICAAPGGKVNLAKASDGLAGELYTEDGWIARHSKEPPSHYS